MGHQESYLENEAYAQFLEGWDESFYAKYADYLAVLGRGSKALDVGCGVGQVVARLLQSGCDAYGLDVSKPNIERAQKVSPNCVYYDGEAFPFEDGQMDAAGALNVLEHVDNPESFIRELCRVVRPGGRIVLSSPNFFRVLGLNDYHYRMRGIGRKWRNWKRIREKLKQMRDFPEEVRFDRMDPIVRENFQPDDDAIVVTNPFEMGFFLERNGCRVVTASCADRYVAKWASPFLELNPFRRFMFNAFLVAEKIPA